jgi:phage terminase large subunit
MNKELLMKKYDCDIFKDFGFDDKRKYWVAIGNEGAKFQYADGWTLIELEEAMTKQIN